MAVVVIDKIEPKNDAFVGLIDADQVIGLSGYISEVSGSGNFDQISGYIEATMIPGQISTASGHLSAEIDSDILTTSGYLTEETNTAISAVSGYITANTGYWENTDGDISSSGTADVLINGSLGIGKSPASNFHIYKNNSDVTTTQLIEQDGEGDAALTFRLTANREYVLGVDNSDSDWFKINAGDPNVALNNRYFAMNYYGRIGMGTGPDSSYRLNVSGLATANNHGAALFDFAIPTTTVASRTGLGLRVNCRTTGSTANNTGSLWGVNMVAVHDSPMTLTEMQAFRCSYGIVSSAGSGTITTAGGVWIQQFRQASNGTMTTAYDYYSDTPNGVGGTIVNDWVFYSAHNAPSRFLNNFLHQADNGWSKWGAGDDCGISYDGSDMIFNSRMIGTGNFKFLSGNIEAIEPTELTHISTKNYVDTISGYLETALQLDWTSDIDLVSGHLQSAIDGISTGEVSFDDLNALSGFLISEWQDDISTASGHLSAEIDSDTDALSGTITSNYIDYITGVSGALVIFIDSELTALSGYLETDYNTIINSASGTLRTDLSTELYNASGTIITYIDNVSGSISSEIDSDISTVSGYLKTELDTAWNVDITTASGWLQEEIDYVSGAIATEISTVSGYLYNDTGSYFLYASGTNDKKVSVDGNAVRFAEACNLYVGNIDAVDPEQEVIIYQNDDTKQAGIRLLASGGNFTELNANGSNHPNTFLGSGQANASQLMSYNSSYLQIGSTDNVPIMFGNNDVERFRIDTDGNIGINCPYPTQLLTMKHANPSSWPNLFIEAAGIVGVALGVGGPTATGTIAGANKASSAFLKSQDAESLILNTYGPKQLVLGTNNTARLTITGSGLVGIGGEPNENLQITNTIAGSVCAVKIKSIGHSTQIGSASYSYGTNYGGQTIGGYSLFWGADASGMMIGNNKATDINFATNDTVRFKVTGAGDVLTNDSEYYASSSPSGWSSVTSGKIYYRRIGKQIFVTCRIDGTSNATYVKFKVPYASSAETNRYVRAAGWGMNNTAVLSAPIMFSLAPNTEYCDVYSTFGEGAWTDSGQKIILGEFFYTMA